MPLFGSSSHDAPPPLAGVGRAIGVLPAFAQHPQQIALKVREKKISLSGDSFAVKDAVSGAKVFAVEGKVLSISARKTITDANGNVLYTLHKKHFHLHPTFEGVGPNDDVLFTIQGGIIAVGGKLTITFNNVAGGGGETELKLKGDWFDRKASITLDDVPVAHISRSFLNAGQLLFDDQTYILTVAPGVDAALMLAACVCLDETQNEPK